MSYKSTLQEHNTKLQQAIDKANALPDAGVETCTLVYRERYGDYSGFIHITVFENGSVVTIDRDPNEMSNEYFMLDNVVKGSIICLPAGCPTRYVEKAENVTPLGYGTDTVGFVIHGDAEICIE